MTIIRVLEKEDLTKDILEIKSLLLERAREIQKELQQARKKLTFTKATLEIAGDPNKVDILFPTQEEFDALNNLICILEEKLNLLFDLLSETNLRNYMKELEKENNDLIS